MLSAFGARVPSGGVLAPKTAAQSIFGLNPDSLAERPTTRFLSAPLGQKATFGGGFVCSVAPPGLEPSTYQNRCYHYTTSNSAKGQR